MQEVSILETGVLLHGRGHPGDLVKERLTEGCFNQRLISDAVDIMGVLESFRFAICVQSAPFFYRTYTQYGMEA